LTPEEARTFIHDNCKDIEAEGFDYASGHGLFCLPEEMEVNMPKIYISPSSQSGNKGLPPYSNEAREMNQIADLLIPLLIKDGRYSVARNNPAMNVYQMAKDSNTFKADIHVAIHSNAGGGQGTEVFAYGPGTNSEKLAKCLYNQIAPLSPGADRGVKYNKGLVEVGDAVEATACLIELAFHDNAKDATWLAYNHEMIADRLYKGICDYFGYEYRATIVTPAVEAPVAPVVDNKAKAIALLEQAIALLK
jgi:N-acetylmuramoyl-L-alanine amidase